MKTRMVLSTLEEWMKSVKEEMPVDAPSNRKRAQWLEALKSMQDESNESENWLVQLAIRSLSCTLSAIALTEQLDQDALEMRTERISLQKHDLDALFLEGFGHEEQKLASWATEWHGSAMDESSLKLALLDQMEKETDLLEKKEALESSIQACTDAHASTTHQWAQLQQRLQRESKQTESQQREMEKQNAHTSFLRSKKEEYEQSVFASMASLSHRSLVDYEATLALSEKADALTKEVEAWREKVDAYAGLPTDTTEAQLDVAALAQQVEEAQQRLAAKIGAPRHV